uniref:2-oxoglutarate dehydrogenase E1 component N-terminal domain-containing protein n=1 Tax=Parascaris univalens TaxID=6257 RepID=A0A915A1R1_PARUN
MLHFQRFAATATGACLHIGIRRNVGRIFPFTLMPHHPRSSFAVCCRSSSTAASSVTKTLLVRSNARVDGAYVQQMYDTWRKNPSSVHSSWDGYFRSVDKSSFAVLLTHLCVSFMKYESIQSEKCSNSVYSVMFGKYVPFVYLVTIIVLTMKTLLQ